MQAIALRVLAALGPLTQHLGAYAQLGAAAVDEYRTALARRLAWALLALVAGTAGLAATWMIGLAVFWDTPWRVAYVASTAAALLLIGAIAAYVAMSAPRSGQAARVLRTELHRDRELFEEWTRNL